MSWQFSILVLVFLSVSVAGIWFYFERNALVYLHEHTVKQLEMAIYLHKNQIKFRENKLNLYDFQRYNLDESLVEQQEIRI